MKGKEEKRKGKGVCVGNTGKKRGQPQAPREKKGKKKKKTRMTNEDWGGKPEKKGERERGRGRE